MNLLDPIFITILIFGTYTSYTDIKHGKIKNISVILLLISGLFINIFITKTLSTFDLNVKSDFMQTIINFFVSLTFGFLLWSAGLWSSGDAKLFLGYSLLLPVFTYKHGYVSFFPSFGILINTFIPIAIFYILNSIFHAKNLKASIKGVLSPKSLINLVFFIFGLSFILQYVLNYFNIKLNFIFQMIILFILVEVLNKISPKATLNFSIILSLLRIMFFYNSIFTISFLSKFLYSIILLSIFTFIASITEFYSEMVKIKDLKPGMLLNEQLIKTKKGMEKKELSLITIFGMFQCLKEGVFGDVKNMLTEEDIRELKKLKKEKKLKFDEIKIAKTMPFAPFMLFGVLLTYFLQGSLFYYLYF